MFIHTWTYSSSYLISDTYLSYISTYYLPLRYISSLLQKQIFHGGIKCWYLVYWNICFTYQITCIQVLALLLILDSIYYVCWEGAGDMSNTWVRNPCGISGLTPTWPLEIWRLNQHIGVHYLSLLSLALPIPLPHPFSNKIKI